MIWINYIEFGYNIPHPDSFCEEITGPLFTKKTPSYGYKDPRDKHKTAWRPSQVYNGNPYTDKTTSS